MAGDASVGLAWGGTVLTIGARGRARLGATGPAVAVAPPGPGWGEPRLESYEGEATLTWSGPAGRFVVRHHVGDDVWSVRATVTRAVPGGEPRPCRLGVEPGDGSAWVWAAGQAGLVVLVDDPARPVVLRLRRGRLDADSYAWSPPAADGVVELSGERHDGWGRVPGLLPGWLPRLTRRVGDDVELALPDDVVSGPGVTVGPDGTAVVGGVGAVDVRVVGRSGDLRLRCDFAPPFEQVLARTAERLAAAAEVPAVTESAAARLLVLHAGGATESDAYDLLAGALVERPAATPLATLALGRLAADGDRAAAAALPAAVAGVTGPGSRPVGFLLAVVAPSAPVARLVAPPAEDLAGLTARLGHALPGDPVPDDPAAAARDVARLALALAERADPAPDADTVRQHATLRLLSRHGDDETVLAWLLVAGLR